nr:uncharacterized protein K02A2.6-like [Aedes albopictus]
MDLFYFEGHTLLIFVDSYSKYIDVRLMKGSNSLQLIEQVESFFANFGIAEEIVTDNGPPFNSELFVRFLEANSVRVSKSPPYHPQSNGLAERGVRTVKDVLKKYLLDDKQKSLSVGRKINRFLINYRNTPCTVTNRTPSSMVFTYTPRTLTNSINPRKVELESTQAKPVVRVDDRINQSLPEIKCTYRVGDKVLYRNHFKELVRWIPVIILKKLSPLTYLISVEGNVRIVHTNQIRVSDLSDIFHPSLPIAQPVQDRIEQSDESTRPADATSVGSREKQSQPASKSSTKQTSKKKSQAKRRRSESKSPKVRRSNRLRGQPRLKYPK